MGLQVDEEDVTDVIIEHSVGLMTENLKERHVQQCKEVLQEMHMEVTTA